MRYFQLNQNSCSFFAEIIRNEDLTLILQLHQIQFATNTDPLISHYATNFERSCEGHIAFGLWFRASVLLFDACLILWTLHARVLNFHVWIPHGKIADTIFFLSELSPFLELCPIEIVRMKSCQQVILKSIGARGLKLGPLIGGWWLDYLISFWTNSVEKFPELWPFENLGISNLSARYHKNYLS